MAQFTALQNNVYEVVISGTRLRLKSNQGADDVRKMVQFVEGKIESIRKMNPNAPFQSVLVLSCLQIAEETIENKRIFADQLAEIKLDSLEILSEIENSPLVQQQDL